MHQNHFLGRGKFDTRIPRRQCSSVFQEEIGEEPRRSLMTQIRVVETLNYEYKVGKI